MLSNLRRTLYKKALKLKPSLPHELLDTIMSLEKQGKEIYNLAISICRLNGVKRTDGGWMKVESNRLIKGKQIEIIDDIETEKIFFLKK